MEDNSKKVGQFLWRLNQGDVSPGVAPKLLALCQAIDGGDWATANQIQVSGGLLRAGLSCCRSVWRVGCRLPAAAPEAFHRDECSWALSAAGWVPVRDVAQVQMTTMDWDECGFWLPSVKRMIKMRSSA